MKRPKRKTKAQKMEEAKLPQVLESAPVCEFTEFTSPESSSIQGATYDAGAMELKITFTRPAESGTRVYLYPAFPLKLWTEFVQAESKGKFYASAIRPMFKGIPWV
jgi:hypothetical protein